MKNIFMILGFLAATLVCPRLLMAEVLSNSDRDTFAQQIHRYLLTHPEDVVEALKLYNEKQKALEDQNSSAQIVKNRDLLERSSTDFVAGNPKGDVTIVEFFDARCPYCKSIDPKLFGMLDEDGRIRLVLKELPALGEPSVVAAKAAIASRKQGKYLAFHRSLLEYKGQLDEAAVYRVAADIGLNVAQLKTDAANPDVEAELHRNIELAQLIGARGTPTFVIGDRIVDYAGTLDPLKDAVAAMRRHG